MADNYILDANNPLLAFTGEQMHQCLSYVETNALTVEDKIHTKYINTVLETNWENIDNFYFLTQTIDLNDKDAILDNKDDVHIIISPTEDIVMASDSKSETSREVYNNAIVRCIDYNVDNDKKKITLTFKADDLIQPTYSVKVNILILYRKKMKYNIPERIG